MSGASFRGVSAAQDSRFGDKTKKLIKSTKFPDSFSTRVDMGKVKVRTPKCPCDGLGAPVRSFCGESTYSPPFADGGNAALDCPGGDKIPWL